MPRKSVCLAMLVGSTFALTLAWRVRGDDAATGSPADPIEWSKPEKPASFREVLKTEDYKRQFETAAAKIDIAALVKANWPAAGSRVMSVTPGTPAAQLGLQPGDLLTKLDGEQLWGEWHRRSDQPQTMTYLTKDGRTHDAQIQPGTVGFSTHFEWQPQFEYLRGTSRDPRWDKEVLVGILERSTNPDLAETALHYAVAAGLATDQLLDGVGAEIALEQGRNAAAMDFVWSALVDHRTERKPLINPEILYRVAIANYKLDVAAEVLRDYHRPLRGQPDPEMIRCLARMHRARAESERCQPPPSVQAVDLRRFNLTPILEPANEWTAKDFKDFLKDRDSFTLNLPSSYFNFLEYKPKTPVRDMEAVLKMTIRCTDNNPTDYAQIVQLWLSDQSMNGHGSPFIGDERAPNLLFLAFADDPKDSLQTLELGYSGISGTECVLDDHSVKLDGKQVIEVRLIRIGGEGEVFVNGRRVLYVPIDPLVTDLGFAMKIVGMTVEVKQFSISKLVSKATVVQATSGNILLKAIDANVHGGEIRYEIGEDKNCIGGWASTTDSVDWDVQVDRPRRFDVAVSTACLNELAGSKYVVVAGPEPTASVAGVVKATGDWTTFKEEKLGTIEIVKPGRITVAVRVTSKPGSHVMNLRQIELRPAK